MKENIYDNCQFTLEHYKNTLEKAKKKYKFLTFSEAEKLQDITENIIVLRHDIDFSLECALNIARLENGVGVKSTYFLRIDAKYNLLEYKNYNILKELEKLGHEIGLHIVEGYSELFNEDKENTIQRHINILENILGHKISGIATHEPARMGQEIKDNNLTKYGLKYQAYSDKFVKKMKYISDSGGRWREDCMCKFIEGDYKHLCILTHPIWWYNKSTIENY